MKLRRAVGFLIVSLLAPLAGAAEERIFDSGPGILRDPAVLACFAQLVREGEYGFRNFERAAFLISQADHSLQCIHWPSTHELKQARWSGPMPAGVVAVAHTHPLSSPNASPDDVHEARRIGMPIFILTPNLIKVVHADGRVETLVCRMWIRAAETSVALGRRQP
jgi:hypothetical protein